MFNLQYNYMFCISELQYGDADLLIFGLDTVPDS